MRLNLVHRGWVRLLSEFDLCRIMEPNWSTAGAVVGRHVRAPCSVSVRSPVIRGCRFIMSFSIIELRVRFLLVGTNRHHSPDLCF